MSINLREHCEAMAVALTAALAATPACAASIKNTRNGVKEQATAASEVPSQVSTETPAEVHPETTPEKDPDTAMTLEEFVRYLMQQERPNCRIYIRPAVFVAPEYQDKSMSLTGIFVFTTPNRTLARIDNFKKIVMVKHRGKAVEYAVELNDIMTIPCPGETGEICAAGFRRGIMVLRNKDHFPEYTAGERFTAVLIDCDDPPPGPPAKKGGALTSVFPNTSFQCQD